MSALVVDVGMHNGDDTAYYLSRGYDVVAVEANAALCRDAEERFAEEIGAGRLTIRNCGIADQDRGELDFWISNHTEWSSFHEANATQEGTPATRVRVPTATFTQLLSEHPAPLYVKVDIERNDALCISGLADLDAPPPYFSFEGHLDAAADIDVLVQAGYTRFKCVRQIDWLEITPENMRRQATIRVVLSRVRQLPGGRRVYRHLHRLHYRGERDYAVGSSGPLGRELPGRWLSRDEIVAVWQHRLAVDRRLGANGLGEWFDIHAAIA